MFSLNSKQLVRPSYPAKLDKSNPLTKGLVGYWPLSEGVGSTAYNLTDSRINGALVNSPSSVVDKFGKALNFNGTTQYANFANTFNIGYADLSVGVWFKTKNNSINFLSMVSKSRYGTNTGRYNLHYLSGAVNFLTQGNTAASNTITSTINSSDDQWHFALATMTRSSGGAILNLYVDGIKACAPSSNDTTLANTINLTNSDILIIGANSSTTGSTPPATATYFSGQLANAMIYNRALSESEVLSLYQNPWQLYEQKKTASWLYSQDIINTTDFFGVF
jgi:hypothetical protein